MTQLPTADRDRVGFNVTEWNVSEPEIFETCLTEITYEPHTIKTPLTVSKF